MNFSLEICEEFSNLFFSYISVSRKMEDQQQKVNCTLLEQALDWIYNVRAKTNVNFEFFPRFGGRVYNIRAY